MQPQVELAAGFAATCCSTLQYLEGAAYIAIVLAVFGVPQLLTYYLDRRDRRRDRQEERAEAERRHQETMTALMGTLTALTAILERNGHSATSDQSGAIEELRQRVAELEAENARLRNGNDNTPSHDSAIR